MPTSRESKPRRASARSSRQLPAGRHGLDRDYVVANQRERILAAIAEVSAAVGYPKVSVEDVIKAAGVSRRTFYDHFPNKEAPFLAAYDEITEQLLVELRTAYAGAETFAEGVRDCLQAFLEFVAAHPEHAHMCIVEVLAAGPEALGRRNATMRQIADLFDQGAKADKDTLTVPPLVAETIVGGIYEVVYARVLRDELGTLPDLLPDLVYSALLPYLGPDRATAEYERLKRRRERMRSAAASA